MNVRTTVKEPGGVKRVKEVVVGLEGVLEGVDKAGWNNWKGQMWRARLR